MLVLTIDRRSVVPAYRQIRDRIGELVDAGALAPGDRLPPTRVLARTTGLHRSTIVRAYGELWSLGYLESRRGSYSTVRRRARLTVSGSAESRTLIDWAGVSTVAVRSACEERARLARERGRPREAIDFSRLSTDPRLIPTEDLRRCLKTALVEDGPALLDYGDAAGYGPLRDAIARHMCVHGTGVSADEVLVTSGAQNALDLVLRAFTNPGDRVVVESPTYAAALALGRLHALELVPIPMREAGMDLDSLEVVLAKGRPRLVYTIPSFHNPTGITTNQAHRERLLALCEAHRVPVVEDGFEEEMKYFGKAVLPLKSMDTGGVVIYVGTLSKVAFPGLRIGWIVAARECVDRLAAMQRVACLSGNTLAQAAVARFWRSGLYESFLRRIHRAYRRRMQAMLAHLASAMPPEAKWTRPSGGYTVWLSLPGCTVDGDALSAQFARDGVRLTPGSRFFLAPPDEVSFRLSISCVDDDEIVEGISRLGRSLTRYLRAVRTKPDGRPRGARPADPVLP